VPNVLCRSFTKPIEEAFMIAILQFDGVSLPHFHQFIEQGRLPTLAALRGRGHWYSLQTPVVSWEGATYSTLYSGRGVAEHGLYFPFMWSAADQRVRSEHDFPVPESVWDRVGNVGRRSLVIDPYEVRQPKSINGKALSGWQFKHKVTLHRWSVPRDLGRQLERRFGRPPLVEEVYGRPSAHDLFKMRTRLLGAPKRVAEVAATLLSEESFDLAWITLSSSHIAGHWFLDASRLPQKQFDAGMKAELDATLCDAYAAVDEAMSSILAALPLGTDIIVLSPSGMGPNSSRSHLLPGMLQALLTGSNAERSATKIAPGSSLWRLRAALPPGLRAWVARVLPDHITLDITARLETRGVDWTKTRAFMIPSGDCGYIRLNLKGRERDGIVSPEEADALLGGIVSGLKTFRDLDGEPAIKKIEFAPESLGCEKFLHPFPDLIVHWSERLPPHLAGVSSAEFGEVPSPGWGSGRTGEHCDSAWALIVPGTSRLKTPMKPLHIIDIASTVCGALGVNTDGLIGQALLEPYPRAIPT
jgi:predicted AlkP superfamily phosphohydrolase/phosphomutase